ncbi:MAG: hypothetical protein ABFR89_11610 [Actinomycetota bacterium]
MGNRTIRNKGVIAHRPRTRHLLLAVALFATTFGALVAVDDAALAASKAHCNTEMAAGTHVLDVDGYDVLLYVPESARKKHVPLVVNLHPSFGTGDATLTESLHVADENGFAMLTPSGPVDLQVLVPWFNEPGFEWNVPGVPLFSIPGSSAPPETRDDVEFIEHAIDAAAEAMCIDLARVYAMGFSGGARMASQLACDLGDRIAAVVPIAGVRFPLASDATDFELPDSQDCAPVRNIPILAIHGLIDGTNPWATGTPGTAWSYSGETAVDRWVDFNSCRETPYVTAMTDDIDLIEYRACHNNADVTVVMVNNGGHAIPGHVNPYCPEPCNTDEVDGYDLAWDLLAPYKLPGKYVAALSKG